MFCRFCNISNLGSYIMHRKKPQNKQKITTVKANGNTFWIGIFQLKFILITCITTQTKLYINLSLTNKQMFNQLVVKSIYIQDPMNYFLNIVVTLFNGGRSWSTHIKLQCSCKYMVVNLLTQRNNTPHRINTQNL